jgi:Big-like domain-containing protein
LKTATGFLATGGLLTGALLAGCSYPSAEQPFPGACAPLTVLSSMPDDDAGGVPTDAPISLAVSDFPDPDSVRLDTVLLSSGVYTRLGGFFVDFITHSIRFTPRNQLQADLTYAVTLTAGVRTLTGCSAKFDQRTFRTGDGPSDPPLTPPDVPAFGAAILPIFAAHCGGGSCHRPQPDDGSCLDAPAQGLSLCDRDAFAALVYADATELAGMKRVQPGDAARSYLIRKIVPGPNGGPVPTTPGHRDPPDAPLPDTDLRAISDWINGGAPN